MLPLPLRGERVGVRGVDYVTICKNPSTKPKSKEFSLVQFAAKTTADQGKMVTEPTSPPKNH
jgi:hypothetical protein